MIVRGLERSPLYPLGDRSTSVYVSGTLAMDVLVAQRARRLEGYDKADKVTLTLRKNMQQLIKANREVARYPGSSTGNFVNQLAEFTRLDPLNGTVHLFTSLAPKDPTTAILEEELEASGVVPHITPFTNIGAANPEALLIPYLDDDGSKHTQIISYKSTRMPAIEVDKAENAPPGILFINAAAGQSAESIYNGLEFADEYSVPVGTLATISEINQFGKNRRLKEASIAKMEAATFFSGNTGEAKGLILAKDPHFRFDNSEDPRLLAQQLRDVYHNPAMIVFVTEGKKGSHLALGETIFDVIVENPLENYDNTVGAGDAAGALVAGRSRLRELTADNVIATLETATFGAEKVMMYPDARQGQLRGRQQLLERPVERRPIVIPKQIARWV